MASDYEYITVANLEALGVDYSVVNAVYTNTIIEAQISLAEMYINTRTKGNSPFTGTIPDGIIGATLIIAERNMRDLLISHNDSNIEAQGLIDKKNLKVEAFLNPYLYRPSGSIPMSGVNR